MTANDTGWRELVAGGNGLKVAVFAGGVGLQAIEVFIGSTLLPSVVAEIGGLELFAWNATVFIVASIVASIFAAIRPFGLGPRGNYIIAATAFGLGSLICGLAPDMIVMLAGRTVQGFGAGLIVALTYGMIRLVFAQHLWPRAMALISTMWGIATLLGPAVGGVFAELGQWRLAFYVLVPLSVLLGIAALKVLPVTSGERGLTRLPIVQMGLVIAAMAAISVAGVVTGSPVLSLALVAAGVLAVAVVGLIERRADVRLLPRGTFTLGSALAIPFAVMMLMQLAITSDVFVPLFMQKLHGISPLWAGYLVALVAAGWSLSSVATAGWTGRRASALIGIGPMLIGLGTLGLALFVPRGNGVADPATVGVVSLSLLALGSGIGIAWQQLSTRILGAAPEGEGDLTSAAIGMTQMVATGLGAALAGLIVNLGGLAATAGTAGAASAAQWLYGLFALVPLVAIPLAWRLVRSATPMKAAPPVPAE